MIHTHHRRPFLLLPLMYEHTQNVPLFCIPSMICALDMCAYITEAQQTNEVTNNVHIRMYVHVQTG